MCGTRPANRGHGRGVRPHPLAVAHGELALASRERASTPHRHSIPEWLLVCATHNVLKLWRVLRGQRSAAAAAAA
jgi:hypothetical protein